MNMGTALTQASVLTEAAFLFGGHRADCDPTTRNARTPWCSCEWYQTRAAARRALEEVRKATPSTDADLALERQLHGITREALRDVLENTEPGREQQVRLFAGDVLKSPESELLKQRAAQEGAPAP